MTGACIIRLVGMAVGMPTEFDGLYVEQYDPAYVHPDGYDGGLLEVTADPAKALRFTTFADALAKYRESYGLRPDGEPNRPLTAWTVEIVTAPNGKEA